MPIVRCTHCGEQTFTIAGWADVDHCSNCGRPLVERQIDIAAALKAKRKLPEGRPVRPRSVRHSI